MPPQCVNNVFFHNNFINNYIHVSSGSISVWDDGYPSGGNYWDNYTGVDWYGGLAQNELGSDGIGDTPHTVYSNNQDNYPLMKPYPWGLHDIGVTRIDVKGKTFIGKGIPCPINVTIFNYGSNEETFNATTHAYTTVFETDNIVLASHTSTTFTEVWNTSDLSYGIYSITTIIDTVDGETDTEDNTYSISLLVTIQGDVNGDKKCDLQDIFQLILCFGAERYQPYYNPNYDINDDGKIDLIDIFIVILHYGESW